MPRYYGRGGNQDEAARAGAAAAGRATCAPGGRGLYRSRNGRFLGVCKGLADYFDLPLFWVRTFTVLLILFTGLWPGLALYFIAALVMRLEPVIAPSSGPSASSTIPTPARVPTPSRASATSSSAWSVASAAWRTA